MENNGFVEQSDDEGEIFIDSSTIQSEIILDAGDAEGLDLDEDMDDSSANPEESSGEKPKDESIQRFLSHKDSVYCIAIHPECDLNANVNTVGITGGGDEVAFIFNITTGTELFRLSGHTDSVVSVGFNFNGKLVATGSYDATVKIWETETGKLLFTLEGPQNEIEWVQWHSKGNVVLAGSRDGNIWMWNTVDGKCMSVFGGHTAPVTCGGFSADGKLVVSGSEDATVRIWDPKTSAVIHTLKGHGFHTEPITCIETHPNNVVASGSAEGDVKLTNMVNGKLMGSLSNHENSIEALAFSPIAPFLATGSMDSKINLYDLSTLQLRGSCKHDDGITRLVWHPTEPFVFAASVDKTVRLWDGRSAQCAKVWTGHDNTVLDLALTKDGAYFLTASDDQAALVFKV